MSRFREDHPGDVVANCAELRGDEEFLKVLRPASKQLNELECYNFTVVQ